MLIPIYVINGGSIFEGTREQFADCFFSNADYDLISEWCQENGFKLEMKMEKGPRHLNVKAGVDSNDLPMMDEEMSNRMEEIFGIVGNTAIGSELPSDPAAVQQIMDVIAPLTSKEKKILFSHVIRNISTRAGWLFNDVASIMEIFGVEECWASFKLTDFPESIL